MMLQRVRLIYWSHINRVRYWRIILLLIWFPVVHRLAYISRSMGLIIVDYTWAFSSRRQHICFW